MRPKLALRVACLAATAFICGCSSNSGKIEGTNWTSQATTVKGIPVPKGAMKLSFNKDGTFVYMAGPQKLTGSYSLGMGDTVMLHMDQELAGRKDHGEKISITATQLTMTDSDGTSLVFDKQ